jgi:hypothetical protein
MLDKKEAKEREKQLKQKLKKKPSRRLQKQEC